MSESIDRTRPAPLPLNEAARMQTLRDFDILNERPEEALDELAWLASSICGTPIASVTLVDEKRQLFKASVGLGIRETPRDQSFCAHAILQPDHLFMVENALDDDRFAANPLVTGDPHIRFYAGVPMVASNGCSVGALCVIDRVPRRLSALQERALRILAKNAMSHIELRRHASALTELSRLKDDFVATVSHELRTPLTSIKGSLQLLNAADTDHDDRTDLLRVALGNADRLIRMVNDILDIAKIEAGALVLQRRTQTVDALARSAVETVRPIAAAAGVRLAVSMADGLRPINVDSDRMVQALVNLLSNAVKFAPRASVVTLAARTMPDGGVAMTVHDEGGGIPPDRIERLFEKFSQLNPGSSNQGRGTGLGLSITKAIVQEHGASISVTSDRSSGTTFEILLTGDGTSFAQVSASPAADA